MVHVEPQHVSITIHTKRGSQESKVIVGEDSTTEKDFHDRECPFARRVAVALLASAPGPLYLRAVPGSVHAEIFGTVRALSIVLFALPGPPRFGRRGF